MAAAHWCLDTPSVESRLLNRAINKHLWPLLRDFGFSTSGQQAWRVREWARDAVSITSRSMYDPVFGHKIGREFVARFGVLFPCVPLTPFLDWSARPLNPDRPSYLECHVQALLANPQRPPHGGWQVDGLGTQVEAALAECWETIRGNLSWFDRFADPQLALAVLTREEHWIASEEPEMRSYVRGYLALECGRQSLAAAFFATAVASPHAPQDELERLIGYLRELA